MGVIGILLVVFGLLLMTALQLWAALVGVTFVTLGIVLVLRSRSSRAWKEVMADDRFTGFGQTDRS